MLNFIHNKLIFNKTMANKLFFTSKTNIYKNPSLKAKFKLIFWIIKMGEYLLIININKEIMAYYFYLYLED